MLPRPLRASKSIRRWRTPVIRPVIFIATVVVLVAIAVVATWGIPQLGQAQAVPTPDPTIPSLTLVPPSGPVAPGAPFDLTVSFASPSITWGAQFGLAYDPTQLQVTGIDEGDYYRSWAQANGVSTLVVPGFAVDTQKGWVEPLAIALLAGPGTNGVALGRPGGAGVLATVHCVAGSGASGGTTITLQEVVVAQPAAAGVAQSAPSVTVTDAALEIGSAPLGLARRAARPAPRIVTAKATGPWGTAVPWAKATLPAGFPAPRATVTPVPPTQVINGVRVGTPIATSSSVQAPITVDLAPSIAHDYKLQIIVRFADGHKETWLSDPADGLAIARSKLPPGAAIIAAGAPLSTMSHQSAPPPPTRTPGSPIVVSRDLAPNLPLDQKTVNVIRFPDGHEENWLDAALDVSTMAAQLPKGAVIVEEFRPNWSESGPATVTAGAAARGATPTQAGGE
jgi:hypothetical protein